MPNSVFCLLPAPQIIAEPYSDIIFSNEDSIRKTVATATAEQKSFLQKMVAYLKDFIKSIKKLIDLYGDRDKTVRAAVTTPKKQLEDIARQFEAALTEAAKKEKSATETGGVKASRSRNKEKKVVQIANKPIIMKLQQLL